MSTVLIGGFFLLLALSVPIAFAMGLATIGAILAHGSLPMSILAQRTLVGADSYALLAIPFFILAGNLMNGGGITDQIINLANAMVGRFRGGLALTSVTAAMIFSGLSGSAAADASALGKVLIPAMKKQGYGGGFAAALMASACVNGPIIPPSIPLVIYGLSAGKGVSIIALFLGGIVPGILLALSLMVAAYWISVKRNYPVSEAVPIRRDSAAVPAGKLGADDAGDHPDRRHRRHRHGHRERHHRRGLRRRSSASSSTGSSASGRSGRS